MLRVFVIYVYGGCDWINCFGGVCICVGCGYGCVRDFGFSGIFGFFGVGVS